jgi:hypothetical protein
MFLRHADTSSVISAPDSGVDLQVRSLSCPTLARARCAEETRASALPSGWRLPPQSVSGHTGRAAMSTPTERMEPSASTDESGGARPPPEPGLLLVFANGKPAATVVRLSEGEVVLGRDLPAFEGQPDAQMSRRHARVRWTGSRFEVSDLRSLNGTSIDGQVATPETPTEVTRVLRAGSSVFLPRSRPRALRAPRRSPRGWTRRGTGAAGGALGGGARGEARPDAPHHGRERRRQGGHRPRVPRRIRRRRSAVPGRQLRHHPRERGRAPALRRQARGVLGRRRRRRRLRAGRARRHSLPRRGRGAVPGRAGQAAPRARDRRGAPARRLATTEGRAALLLGDAPRSASAGGRGPAARGHLLSHRGAARRRSPACATGRRRSPTSPTPRWSACASRSPCSPSLIEACLLRVWPGNIRELTAEVRSAAQAALAAGSPRLDAKLLARSPPRGEAPPTRRRP